MGGSQTTYQATVRVVSHSMSLTPFRVQKGGFVIVRQNEMHDLTASLLEEVCHDVKTEPDLQPLH